MGTDLAGLAERMPPGISARAAGDADLDRIVAFRNRHGPPRQWMSLAAVRAMEAAAPEPLRLTLLAESSDGELAGLGMTSDGGLWRSADGSWRLMLRVAPDRRRRGIGAALLEQLEAHARANDASRTVTPVRGDEPDGAAFAAAHGYRAFHERIDSWIDVPAFDATRFEDPDGTAGRLGIRLATWAELRAEHGSDIDRLENELLPVIWAMARDVPSPTPMPDEPPPLDQARRMFFEGPGIDPPTTILALRGSAPVGMTVTMLKENGVAYTNFTGVVRSERGKGIALVLKLRALRALKERGARLFGTTNDEQNAAMREINRKLGYTPDPPTTMYEKRFT